MSRNNSLQQSASPHTDPVPGLTSTRRPSKILLHKWYWLFLIILILIPAIVFIKGPLQDTIKFTHADGSEIGVLVDGVKGGVSMQDDTFKSPNGGHIRVGNYTATPGQVVAFTVDRSPGIRTSEPSKSSFIWTPQKDTVDVSLQEIYEINATVWIAVGPFGTQKHRALEARLTTEAIWAAERAGVTFKSYEVMDATGLINKKDDLANISNSFDCPNIGDLPSEIQPKSGQINIYYLNNVMGWDGAGSYFGLWCDNQSAPVIAMGKDTGPDLLAHEMGHALGIEHVDACTDCTTYFDETNVMYPVSDQRAYLTEGQIYRIIVGTGSVINTPFQMRPNEVNRTCQTDTKPQGFCPAVQKRLWADGSTWPPN